MTRILMHGCNGKMGRVITALSQEDCEIEIVAGVDVSDCMENTYPVFGDINDCDVPVDVIIDFSSDAAAERLLQYSVEKQIPLVLCTTGLSEAQTKQVIAAAKQVAILKSANMSLGINTLLDLLQRAAKILAPAGFDMEIVEKHHNQKLDAPSGTALALADALNTAMEQQYTYRYDRSRERKKREKTEIGIQAVRGGTIVGEHEVIFAGTDEVITFTHTAYSKRVFAKGAIEAAKFLHGKAAGLYDMQDVISARNHEEAMRI